jgi:hypothetical protein
MSVTLILIYKILIIISITSVILNMILISQKLDHNSLCDSTSNCDFLEFCEIVYVTELYNSNINIRNLEIISSLSELNHECKILFYKSHSDIIYQFRNTCLIQTDLLDISTGLLLNVRGALNRLLKNKIIIKHNSDNIINMMMNLNRCDFIQNVFVVSRRDYQYNRICSQMLHIGSIDMFIFRYPLLISNHGNDLIGHNATFSSWGCENMIYDVVKLNGYKFVSLCGLIDITHNHKSNVRNTRTQSVSRGSMFTYYPYAFCYESHNYLI